MARFALILLLAASCVRAPPRDVVVRAGRLLDGTGASVREHVLIRIHEGLIAGVERDEGLSAFAPGARVLDARELTVLPGLVTYARLVPREARSSRGRAALASAVHTLHALAAAGVTTVADLGSPTTVALALRSHVGLARHRGPRVMVAGFVGDASSPEQARVLVRDLAELGVDLVSVSLGAMDPTTLCALVEEAHRQELRVLGQTSDAGGPALASTCGIDALVPSASCALPTARLAEELRRRLASGLSPTQALAAVTSGAAGALGLQDALGVIKVGYRADLIAVAGRPDERIDDIANVSYVFIDGIEQRPGEPDGVEIALAWLRLVWPRS